ncbi:FixH family protein [Vaginella massiliensis]|uniref:FixH family protein n=1 Tax=Vaginella massiliensis TaxID=1816680 RepID=UPI003753C779
MKFKFTWGHGIAVALLCFMIFILSLMFFAGDTGDLVTDNYYEKSIEYEDDIEAESRTLSLQKQPEVVIQANGWKLIFPAEYQITEGSVVLLRSNNPDQDLILPLKLDAKNQMLIPSAKLVNGDYEMRLSWEMNHNKYLVKKTVKWQSPS